MAGIIGDQTVEQILATVDNTEFGYDDWNLAYIEIQRLSAKWKELGIVLGISGDKLDAIAGNHQNLTDRLANVLQQWIGQNYNTKTFGIPSWRTLCGAIQKVSDNTFFEAVAAKHPISTGGRRGSGDAPPSNKEILLSATPKIGEFTVINYKGKDGSEKKLQILDSANFLWRDVAGQLFPDKPNHAKGLGAKYNNDPTECLRELLQGFLTKGLPDKYTRDWKGIIKLFGEVDDKALAEEIEWAVLNKVK